ncbi:related to Mig2 [Ustilago sp. UG-2017b]|nr:related to Mig2 [Ustilago sp. UG-2017b]
MSSRSPDPIHDNYEEGHDCVEASSKPNRLDTFDTYFPPSANNLKKRSPLETTDPKIGTPVKVNPADELPAKFTYGRPKPAITVPDADDYYQDAPKLITITSSLSTTPADKGYLGICKLPFSAYDGIFSQDDNPRGSSVQAFMAAAQNTAKCTWLSPTDVRCVEQGGKADMNVNDMIWWETAFCKRCSDAGGKSKKEFDCPYDSNGAKTKEKEEGWAGAPGSYWR